MPEIFPNRSWQNQTIVSLLNGNPLFEFQLNQKFGYLRDGMKEPELDNFTHESLLYTIKNKKSDITFVHYSDLDSMRHCSGFYSEEANAALLRHDKRLGEIIITLKENDMYNDSTIIILGDHSSMDEDKIIELNVLLKNNGYIDVDERGKIKNYRAISKNCDGCAYIYLKNKDDKLLIDKLYSLIENFNKENQCIEEIYKKDIVMKLGADPNCAFMVEAKKGFYFLDDTVGDIIKYIKPEDVSSSHNITRATHGYSPYRKDYTTVFMASGRGVKRGVVVDDMNLVDEGPTMAKLLGIELKDADGRIINEILE